MRRKSPSTKPLHLVVFMVLVVGQLVGCHGGDSKKEIQEAPLRLDVELGSGEVRAGIVTRTDELIGGPRAEGEIGDYKIYNSRVEFIIRSPMNPAVGWSCNAGNLVDADWARPAEESGKDCLWEHAQLVGALRGFLARSIEVVGAGGRSEAAVIRVHGKDGGIQKVDGTIRTRNYKLDIFVDYILEPDANQLFIRTTLGNTTDREMMVMVGDLPSWPDKIAPFAPGDGLGGDEIDPLRTVPYFAGINRIGLDVSYGLAPVSAASHFWVPYKDGEISPCFTGPMSMPPRGTASYSRYFIMGDGDTGLIAETVAALHGDTLLGTLSGRVEVPDTCLPTEVEVHVMHPCTEKGDGYAAILIPDEAGNFDVVLRPGEYGVVAKAKDHPDSEQAHATVVLDETTNLTIAVPPTGVLFYEVTEEGKGPIPCKIVFQEGFDADPDAREDHLIWSPTGMGRENVLPGLYTVTAARGYEYEIETRNMEILAGEEHLFEATIARSVDTQGFMAGDFHIHSEYSWDTQLLAELRIRCLIAEGIEIPVFTDHDNCADFAPTIRALGVEDLIRPVTGVEISPAFAHVNAWPMTRPKGDRHYFGVPIAKLDDEGTLIRKNELPECWTEARERYGAEVIQVNHPRSGSNGWFSTLDYDREVGVESMSERRWSPDFDALEVFNGGTWDDDFSEALPDWYSLLNQGLAYTVTGNSDSHSARSTVGYPRNLFAMPTDDPAEADPKDMNDSVLTHASMVSGGPFVCFEANGAAPMGSLITDTDGEVILHATVQAPTWMELGTLSVIANGETVVSLPIEGEGVVRFDEDISVYLERDTWYVVLVEDEDHALGPVNPGERIFAITNPIWVDADGNGVFDAPGVS